MAQWRSVEEVLEKDTLRQIDEEAGDEESRLAGLMAGRPSSNPKLRDDEDDSPPRRTRLRLKPKE